MKTLNPNNIPMVTAREHLSDLIESDKAFSIGAARISIIVKGEVVTIASAGDVYDALEKAYVSANAECLIVHTTGWAAPLKNGEVDGAPSEHPERRRVALICVIDDFGVGSALAFQDNPEEIVTDEGAATGALADAIAECWSRKVN